MNEFFHDNGHLTQDALHCLVNGADADEICRLELAEHLSFCDCCLDGYMALLSDSLLIDPPSPQADSIIKIVTRRARILFFNRYTRAAVAACLAITLWTAGVFSTEFAEKNSLLIASVGTSAAAFGERVTEWRTDLSSELREYFQFDGIDSLNKKGASSHEKE